MAWGGVPTSGLQVQTAAQPRPPSLSACAADVAALQEPLLALAAELRCLVEARARTASSISAVCEVALGQASAPEALQRLRDSLPAPPVQLVPELDEVFIASSPSPCQAVVARSRGASPVELEYSFQMDASPVSDAKDMGSPLFDLSVSAIDQESTPLRIPGMSGGRSRSASSGVALLQVFSPTLADKRRSMSDFMESMKQSEDSDEDEVSVKRANSFREQDTWAAEVMSRIRLVLERSLRDPREVFYRYCLDGQDFMYRGDLSRMLKAFEPDLADALHLRLWSHLGKDGEYDALTYEEFRKLFGPCMSPPPHVTLPGSEASRSSSPSSMSDASPVRRSSFSSWNDSDMNTACFSDASRNNPLDERRARVLLYRLGRALKADTSGQLQRDLTREKKRKSMTNPGASVQEVLQIFMRHRVLLARSEAVALLWMHTGTGLLRPDVAQVVREALEAVESPPPEVSWAQQAIASAGASRTGDSTLPLATALAGLGVAADAQDLQELIGKHSQLDEDSWETLLLVLDKRTDGKILVEPLVQWIFGIGLVASREVHVVSVQDMFEDSPRNSGSDSEEHEASAGSKDEEIPKFLVTSPVHARVRRGGRGAGKRLSAVEEGFSDEESADGTVDGQHVTCDELPAVGAVSFGEAVDGEDGSETDDFDAFAPISFGPGIASSEAVVGESGAVTPNFDAFAPISFHSGIALSEAVDGEDGAQNDDFDEFAPISYDSAG